MKKRFLIVALIGLVLVLGMVLAGCDKDPCDGDCVDAFGGKYCDSSKCDASVHTYSGNKCDC